MNFVLEMRSVLRVIVREVPVFERSCSYEVYAHKLIYFLRRRHFHQVIVLTELNWRQRPYVQRPSVFTKSRGPQVEPNFFVQHLFIVLFIQILNLFFKFKVWHFLLEFLGCDLNLIRLERIFIFVFCWPNRFWLRENLILKVRFLILLRVITLNPF